MRNYISKWIRSISIVLGAMSFLLSCSSPQPNCGSSKPTHELPAVLSEIGVPFDETSALCECMNYPGGEFNVLLSHASDVGVNGVYEVYQGKFLNNGFQQATANETEELIVSPTANSSNIVEYFFKDDLMIHCQVREDIVHDGLQEVILRDVSARLISPEFDLMAAKNELDNRYALLLKALSEADLSQVPVFTKEMLGDRSVVFQFADQFEKGTSEDDRDKVYQLKKMHDNATIIALVKDTEVPFREFDEERDGYKEVFDEEEGRTVTYFQGGSMSGVVYFMDKNTGEIFGKRSIAASNSSQTSDPGKDLMDNYYNEIEKMEMEFGANDRSIH